MEQICVELAGCGEDLEGEGEKHVRKTKIWEWIGRRVLLGGMEVNNLCRVFTKLAEGVDCI
jgi:hypothetical protein